MQNVPAYVSGPPTIIYKNVFCALCHGVSLEVIDWWKVQVGCYMEQDGWDGPTPIPVSVTKHIEIAHFVIKDEVEALKFYDDMPVGRRCMDYWEKKYCSARNMEESIYKCPNQTKGCYAIDDPVVISLNSRTIFFKNKYCAICNGIKINNSYYSDCKIINQTLFSTRCIPMDQNISQQKCVLNYGSPRSTKGTYERPKITIESLLLPENNNCGLGEYMDPVLETCRGEVSCRPGFIMWRNNCIRSPYNMAAYKPPVTNNAPGIVIMYTMYLQNDFVTVGQNYASVMYDIRKAFKENIYLILETFFNLSNETSDWNLKYFSIDEPNILPFLGGIELNFAENTKINMTFWSRKNVKCAYEFIDLTMNEERYYEMQKFVKHTMRKTFRIFTQNIIHPLTCVIGKLISIEINDDMWHYLEYSKHAHRFTNIVVEYIQAINRSYIHVCYLLNDNFETCPLLNYTMDDFYVENKK